MVSFEFYEIVGEGTILAKAYEDAIKATKKVAASLGASGYIPHQDGEVRALKFADKPDSYLWSKVTFRNSNDVGYLPKKNTKEGKSLNSQLSEMKRYPSKNDYLKSIGWDRDYEVIDSRGMYFAVTVTVHNPDVRYFIKVPRQTDDGWTPSDKLKLVSEDEVKAAMDAHNAEAKRLREEARAAA